MTAEEFLNREEYYSVSNDFDTHQAMIDFARHHVEKALENASEEAYVEYIDLTSDEIFDYTDVITNDDVEANVNKDSILNAYPKENIK